MTEVENQSQADNLPISNLNINKQDEKFIAPTQAITPKDIQNVLRACVNEYVEIFEEPGIECEDVTRAPVAMM